MKQIDYDAIDKQVFAELDKKPTKVPRPDPQNLKKRVITVRVSPVELEVLKRWASDEKLPVAELVRQCVFSMEKAQREAEAARAQEIEDCDHGDIDERECLDCGKDMTEWLMAKAEDAFEGER